MTTVADLISLPGKLKTVIRWTLIGCLILLAIVAVVFFHRLPWLLLAALHGYAFPAGLIAGLFFGIAEMIRRSMNGMLLIVDLLLKTTSDIATDARSLQSGEQTLPPPGELVHAVYKQVIYPIVEQVVPEAFGWLGWPILFVYRLTLDRLVRIVIRRFVSADFDDNEQAKQAIQKSVVAATTPLATNQGVIESTLLWARGKVETVGLGLKLLVMLPCYLIFAMVVGLVLLPIIVVAFLYEAIAGGEEVVTMVVSQWS